MATRRQFGAGVLTAGVVGIAGCSGWAGATKTRASGADRTQDIEVATGDTISVEVENEEGAVTVARIVAPSGETVAGSDVTGVATITHTATESGVYTVEVRPARRGYYHIDIE
ncbi:hypothetical protein [Halonotius roseus]|uniref:Uncharacterized protein n=1 Tax=Halonotius roseus TaxID=2511997 RepID=A0A544QN39_9EURY|nr:hypothetical protein [Halonotius roseus]TQQ80331.1 hypothetical protein EWF95_07500 [Halonotius roseus]